MRGHHETETVRKTERHAILRAKKEREGRRLVRDIFTPGQAGRRRPDG
jgi:hypothetical protein